MLSFEDFCKNNNIPSDKSLTNYDIINYAKQLKIKNFQGCFMNDELPSKIKANECGVVNLQSSAEEGSHWCCYFKKGKEKYYFDPYGLEPGIQMLKYLKPTSKSPPLIISTYQIQQFGTVIYGQLALYTLYCLGKGYKFIEIITGLMNSKKGGTVNEEILDTVTSIFEGI